MERIREETVYRIFRLLLLKLHDYGDALLGTLINQPETLQAVTADDPSGNPERLMDEIVERMTVRSATEVTFRLIGGVELTESLHGKGEES